MPPLSQETSVGGPKSLEKILSALTPTFISHATKKFTQLRPLHATPEDFEGLFRTVAGLLIQVFRVRDVPFPCAYYPFLDESIDSILTPSNKSFMASHCCPICIQTSQSPGSELAAIYEVKKSCK